MPAPRNATAAERKAYDRRNRSRSEWFDSAGIGMLIVLSLPAIAMGLEYFCR